MSHAPLRLAAVLPAIVAIALAGCRSDDSASTAATSKAAEENAQDTAQTKLRQCLADHGVDVSPGSGVAKLSDADREKAVDLMKGACKKYRQQAFSSAGIDSQEFQDARVKFRACLADKGVDVPEGQGGLQKLDTDDPRIKAAVDACQRVLPKGLGGDGS
jgi:hypothetical protein